MNFSPEKLIFLVICGVTFLNVFVYARISLNDNGIVGVSQQKLADYITKAIKGFGNVMRQGDDELNYPIMDPYKLEDVSFNYADTSDNKKFRLNFSNVNTTIINGLADYTVRDISVSAKDMRLTAEIVFKEVVTKFPYKFDGHTLKNFLPLYGEGFVELSTKHQKMVFIVDLGIDHGFIIVEKTEAFRYANNIDVKVTGLMDLPDPFATIMVDDILDQWTQQHGEKVLNQYVNEIVEEAIAGMTTDEFFDYLDHFVQKYDQQ